MKSYNHQKQSTEVFYKKVVPRNFPKFRPATLLKKSLWHKESTNPGFWSSDGLRGESAGGGVKWEHWSEMD